jgi:DNA-nicking Smr family endonuclease
MDDEDDASLFRRAMNGVRERKASPRVSSISIHAPAPTPKQRHADDQQVLQEMLAEPDPDWLEHGETLLYRADGLPESVIRRLRRGNYRITRELDLHGLNRKMALEQVNQFLDECRDQRAHCIRIVHGKGNRSPNSGPVLKTLLDRWLRRRQDVLAFCSARPVDGGTGAVYVLLRSR